MPRVTAVRVPPVVWTVVAPLVLAPGYWWCRALDGFNPTDDSFVLAQGWRVWQGQTIHVDFTSPRPMGSAFRHVPDVLNPWGTLAISRLTVVLQQMWIASATVAMADVGRRLTPVQRFLLAGTAPLMKQDLLIVPALVALLLVVSGERRGFYFAPTAIVGAAEEFALGAPRWAFIAAITLTTVGI